MLFLLSRRELALLAPGIPNRLAWGTPLGKCLSFIILKKQIIGPELSDWKWRQTTQTVVCPIRVAKIMQGFPAFIYCVHSSNETSKIIMKDVQYFAMYPEAYVTQPAILIICLMALVRSQEINYGCNVGIKKFILPSDSGLQACHRARLGWSYSLKVSMFFPLPYYLSSA